MSRTPLVIANWKMNTSSEQAIDLADAATRAAGRVSPHCEIGIAPPFPWLVQAKSHAGRALMLGAQDVSAEANGPHTGDVSAAMVAELCTFALVGHSERRQDHGDTDTVVNAKLRAAITAGLKPLLCCGESFDIRQRGEAERYVLGSLARCLSAVDPSGLLGIAYEPVWAIGTGRSATAQDAEDMASAIRTWLGEYHPEAVASTRVLYGGSVNPGNVAGIVAQTSVDGVLVGNASLDASAFAQVISEVARASTV